MGLNSTGTAYNFGQLGSGFSDEAVEVTPPTGKKIISITFLEATVLSTLVASTDVTDTAFFSHTTASTGNGGGAAETDAATSFPAGLTIYGRWDSFTPPATVAGGVIFYFGY
tara:strand:- start:206 stop:541 length:336 start_codon:yes stop_codon:yes gene_type:complete